MAFPPNNTHTTVGSVIYIADKRANTQPHPNADPYYYQAFVVWPSGLVKPALFTPEQIKVAITRAERQPEDIAPRADDPADPWWVKVIKWLRFEV